MSTGPRIESERAMAVAKQLMNLWRMSSVSCMVAGSLRRGRPDVGDIDLVAPMPKDPKRDDLYDAIAATLVGDGLFGAAPSAAIGSAVHGFKRGFRSCSLSITLRDRETGRATSIPVQIGRYAHDERNRGWIEIMRTGPSEFGQMFLRAWKRAQRIPPERQASVDGFLVDAFGQPMNVQSEAKAFALAGMAYVEPSRREALSSHLVRAGGGA